MSFDLSAAAALLKDLYDPQKLMDVTYSGNPFLGLVNKFEKLEGNYWKCPIITGNIQNTSADAAISFAGSANPEVEAFLLTRGKGYNRALLDNETMLASATNKGAFLSTAKLGIDSGLKALSRMLAIQLWRSGWGDIGRIDSQPSATSFKLKSLGDVVNFEIGQKLVFASTQASSALRSATAVTVNGVNRTTGVVSVDTALATPGAQNDDWIFISGDRHNSATPSRVVPCGVRAFIPTTDPASNDSFFGVNRSVDPTRLAGQRLDATGMNPIEIVNKMCGVIDREGGKVDRIFMSSTDYAVFCNELSTKQVYEGVKLSPSKGDVVANVSFDGIKVLTNFGAVEVIPDRTHPDGSYDFLQSDSWTLGSLGEAPQILDRDAQMLRTSGADSYEVRFSYYAQLRCVAPGYNGVAYNVGQ